ncbi:MAG: radical SAM protein [Candidatus Gracilibacteria bacterium]
MDNSYFLLVKGLCNTNCSFCNFYEIKTGLDEYKHFMNLKDEVDKVYNTGIRNINIGVSGYEPTVFKYFFEILDYINKKGIDINLISNGVKLANNDFCFKLKKYIKMVFITIYSSDDLEHHILTQNNDSYTLKHEAIKNCINNNIDISISILLLKPTLKSLSKIIEQISVYFYSDKLCRIIDLLTPNTVMGEDRNKILVPSYTSSVIKIESILDEYNNLFNANNIKLRMNQTIPQCLFGNEYENINLLFQPKQKKIIDTQTIIDRYFFDKCNDCKYHKSCSGIEQEYIKIYGTNEFIEGKTIDNKFSLNNINLYLQLSLLRFRKMGIWFSYDNVDKEMIKSKFIFNLPKTINNYNIDSIFIKNNIILKINFRNKDGISIIFKILGENQIDIENITNLNSTALDSATLILLVLREKIKTFGY